MLYAVVARPQVYGGKVVSYAPAAALKVSGVVRVVQIDATAGAPQFNPLGGVAVIARNTAFTFKGKSVNVRDVAQALGVAQDHGRDPFLGGHEEGEALFA